MNIPNVVVLIEEIIKIWRKTCTDQDMLLFYFLNSFLCSSLRLLVLLFMFLISFISQWGNNEVKCAIIQT